MNKKSSTTLALSSAVLALTLITAACSNDNGNNSNNANATPSATPTVTASADTGGQSSEEAPAKPETHEAVGEYVGLIDSHSIEVRMEDGTVSFQISPEIAEKVDPWESGTPVKFDYSEDTIDVNGEKVSQYTIHSIDKQ